MSQEHGFPKVVQILAKVEATPNVDAVPTPADNAVLCISFDAKLNIVESGTERVRETWPAAGVLIERAWWDLTVKVPVAGPPDPGVGDLAAPAASPFFQASQWAITDVGAAPVTGKQCDQSSQTAQKTLTIYRYQYFDGGVVQLDKMLGAIFGRRFVKPRNGEAYWEYKGSALVTGPPTNPAKPNAGDYATLEQVDKMGVRGHTLEVDGRSDDLISSLEIDWPHEIKRIDDSSEYGVAGFYAALAQPVIKVDPKLVLVGTYDRFTKVMAHTLTSASFVCDTIRGARYTFSAPNLQQGAFEIDEGSDVIRVSPTLYPLDTDAGSGDDALRLTITRAP